MKESQGMKHPEPIDRKEMKNRRTERCFRAQGLKMWKWESSLVETRTFQSNRKVGTFKEPKFEQG
jgi:hypothetical protein